MARIGLFFACLLALLAHSQCSPRFRRGILAASPVRMSVTGTGNSQSPAMTKTGTTDASATTTKMGTIKLGTTMAPTTTKSTPEVPTMKTGTTEKQATMKSANMAVMSKVTTQTPATTTLPITTQMPVTTQSPVTTRLPTTRRRVGTDIFVYKGEFEDALNPSQNSHRITRTQASGQAVLHLDNSDSGKEFRITLCAKPANSGPVIFRPGKIIYSNDGPPDTLMLILNQRFYVNATTMEVLNEFGHGWNKFKDYNFKADDALRLREGNHTIVMKTYTDQYGVDLDAITFLARNQDESVMFLCDAKLVDMMT